MRAIWGAVRTAVVAATALIVISGGILAGPTAAADTGALGGADGYRVLDGRAAAGFAVPADGRLVRQWLDPATGLTFERYQQYAAPLGVFVDGAQLTVARRGQRVALVIGNHYPMLRVAIRPALSSAQAIAIAQPRSIDGTDSSSAVVHDAQLRVEPTTARQFYRVQSSAPGAIQYQDIDAQTGAVLGSWSGLEHLDAAGTGRGVRGDLKSLTGDAFTGTAALTSFQNGIWKMASATGRYLTYDAHNGGGYPANPMTDTDNVWSGGREKAAVDAQYYAALTDHFYLDTFGFDLVGCLGVPIRSVVHFGQMYSNAFWDPMAQRIVFGDGDGTDFGQMSGAQDVVTHELTHAVTTCRAELDYQKESGALNEAFSDMMADAAELDLEEPISSNCLRDAGQATCADWWIGEDLIVGGPDHAIRSSARPGLLGQPSHYADRQYPQANCKPTDWNDYCGVHVNNGTATHAFYLATKGGRNARCSGPTDSQADCDVLVPGVGMARSQQIFFGAWSMLTTEATFCQARDATVAAADLLIAAHPEIYPAGDHATADLAWRAVGVGPCSVPASYQIRPSTHTAATKPGGSADVAITITRSGATQPVTFAVSDPAPATASFTPNPGVVGADTVTLHFDVPADAASGLHPLTVTADDGTTQEEVSIVLAVDSDNPTAVVGAARLAVGDAINVDGHVPLHVSWTTSDATSGVASGALSVDGAPLANGVSGSTVYQSLDGSHSFVASATDVVGHSGISETSAVAQMTFQESAATLTKTWSSFAAGSAWGTTLFSKKKGATATFAFTGTDIAWISSRGPKRGKAKVYIDDVLVAKVDLRASASVSSRIVYVGSDLAAGPHTIRIYVNGTSGRPRVDVDGFVVLSR